MTLPAGHCLGVYELGEPLGASGMGEVYRATDTRLGRDVAIKILPDGLAADSDRCKRFEQEVTSLPGYSEGSYILDYPTWSADGKRVYFSVSRKSGDIYVLEGF